jgi:hypothetical protein
MTTAEGQKIVSETGIDSDQFDFSSLVGREIVLFTEQFPGKRLTSRVIMVNHSVISIDRSKSCGLIDDLVNNQKIVVQFEYRGEVVSVQATMKRSSIGKCNLMLGDTIVPLVRRKFRRYDLSRQAKLAVVHPATFKPDSLARLRWLETDTVNVSCGGVLLNLDCVLRDKSYLFLHVAIQEFLLPQMIVAQVRHSYHSDGGHYNVGLEFIISEQKQIHFKPTELRSMPATVLEYSAGQRARVNEMLANRLRQPDKK